MAKLLLSPGRYRLLTTDLDTGVVVREMYLRNGRLHRDPKEGPAEIWRDAKSGAVTREYYKWRGMYHRDDGPAIIEYSDNGVVRDEWYIRRGFPCRDPAEGPFRTIRDRTGAVEHEEYTEADLHPRPIKPLKPRLKDPKTAPSAG